MFCDKGKEKGNGKVFQIICEAKHNVLDFRVEKKEERWKRSGVSNDEKLGETDFEMTKFGKWPVWWLLRERCRKDGYFVEHQ